MRQLNIYDGMGATKKRHKEVLRHLNFMGLWGIILCVCCLKERKGENMGLRKIAKVAICTILSLSMTISSLCVAQASELTNDGQATAITNERTAKPKGRWSVLGKKTYYYLANGKKATGWHTIDGKTYYFKKTGNDSTKGTMLTGWQKQKGNTYYFKKTGGLGVKGELLTGWQKQKGKNYYFKKTGALGTKGKLLKGNNKSGRTTYKFDKNGVWSSTTANVPVLSQLDYPDISYGPTNISSNGCGIITTSMALRYFAGKRVVLKDVFKLANEGDYHSYEKGRVKDGFFSAAASRYGLKAQVTTDKQKVREALREGNPVLSLHSKGSFFAVSGHWILVRNLDTKNRVRVNEPKITKSKKGFNERTFNFDKDIAATSLKFVIFSK